jgi:hypothetical protein
MGSVRRLPIPYFLTYVLLFLLDSALFLILAWVDGWLPAYQFSRFALMFPMWLWGPLAIMTYLNSVSVDALTNFRPLVDIPDEAFSRLKYEFTTMPARAVIMSGVVWTIVYVVFTYLALDSMYAAYGFGRLAEITSMIRGWISFFIGSAFYYHTVRQLRLVNRIVSTVKQFDLFLLEPVYAFSALTSRTGVSWVVLISLTLLTAPIQAAPFPTLRCSWHNSLWQSPPSSSPFGKSTVVSSRRSAGSSLTSISGSKERYQACIAPSMQTLWLR